MIPGRPGPCLLLLLVLKGVLGEYTWTGTEWKWQQDPKITRDPVLRGDLWEGYGDEGFDDDDGIENWEIVVLG